MEEDPQPHNSAERWYAFRSLAVEAVRRGYEPETARDIRTERLIQIITLPSFDSVVGWQLYQMGDGKVQDRLVALRSCWSQQEDAQRFYNPVERLTFLRLKYLGRLSPALNYFTLILDAASSEKMKQVIATILSVRLMPSPMDKSSGLDGTSYEVNIGDSWAGMRLHWWEEAPTEWLPFAEAAMSLLDSLETRFHDDRSRLVE